jgi:hypothetical protein
MSRLKRDIEKGIVNQAADIFEAVVVQLNEVSVDLSLLQSETDRLLKRANRSRIIAEENFQKLSSLEEDFTDDRKQTQD